MEKQKQEDTEDPADPEQNTETENKDKNNDPADEEIEYLRGSEARLTINGAAHNELIH